MAAVGKELHRLRLAQNLSLRELSRRAGVSNPYLSQIERGEKQPSARILQLLAKPLNVTEGYLLERAGIIPSGLHGTEDVLLADQNLTPTQRHALIEVYRAFVDANNGVRNRKEQ